MEPITVLSLFDGISCGQLALKRANIPVKKYYASEIDKYAIQVTQKNWPDTIQLGDVKNIWARNLPKIDLLIGGSPCQDLSIAKNDREGLKGKRSSLFWHYVRLLRTCKPKWFLLENVASMPKEAKEIITREMGVEPILINSALVSAQQRKRLYWTNIPVTQPEDKGILLKDILESGQAYLNKSLCIKAQYYKTGEANFLRNDGFKATGVAEPMRVPEATKKGYAEIMPGECVDLTQMSSKTRRGRAMKEKSNCLMASEPQFFQYTKPIRIGEIGKGGQGMKIYSSEGKAVSLGSGAGGSTHEKYAYPCGTIRIGTLENLQDSQGNRIYSVRGKSVSLNANGGGGGEKTGLYKIDLPDGEYIIRKLTPVECERLQTLPDNYTEGISDTQRYKCIGNGWTVDVIAHIFKGME